MWLQVIKSWFEVDWVFEIDPGSLEMDWWWYDMVWRCLVVVFRLSRCGCRSVGDLEVVSGGLGMLEGCSMV